MIRIQQLARSAASATLVLTLAACDRNEVETTEFDETVDTDETVEAEEATGSLTGNTTSQSETKTTVNAQPSSDRYVAPNRADRQAADPTEPGQIDPMPPEVIDQNADENSRKSLTGRETTDEQESILEPNSPFDPAPGSIDRTRSRTQPVN